MWRYALNEGEERDKGKASICVRERVEQGTNGSDLSPPTTFSRNQPHIFQPEISKPTATSFLRHDKRNIGGGGGQRERKHIKKILTCLYVEYSYIHC
jgi:hypothetical protein